MNHIYVHVPFCDSICAYCDFFRVKVNDDLKTKYLQALKEEVSSYTINDVSTIYIGGGTPSSLTALEIDELLTIFDEYRNDIVEYTFEANPESLSKEKIQILKAHGVNRVSLGVETLDEHLLEVIHRKHTTKDVLEVISNLHEAGIDNISVDMMYSLPYQTLAMFKEHLEEVCTWDIKHISIYSLTIEEHSEFARKHMAALDNEDEGMMYEEGEKILETHGFKHYEVANYGKDGYESKHNLGYWDYDPYYGFGPGAVGFIDNVRYENTHNFVDYFAGNYKMSEEYTGFKDQMFEYIMVGLRKVKGISLKAFFARFKIKLEEYYKEPIRINIEKGWLMIDDGYLHCSKEGMKFLNTVLLDFMIDD